MELSKENQHGETIFFGQQSKNLSSFSKLTNYPRRRRGFKNTEVGEYASLQHFGDKISIDLNRTNQAPNQKFGIHVHTWGIARGTKLELDRGLDNQFEQRSGADSTSLMYRAFLY